MKKVMDMGKTSVTGSFQLFVGKIAATLVLAIGSIIVGMYILDTDYGLYTVTLVPSMTFLLFIDWGVGAALTKYCAKYRAEKNEGELRTFISSGLIFLVSTGLLLTFLSLLTANFVASTLFGNPDSAYLVAFASITIFSSAIYVGSDAVFVGFEKMKLSTIVLIVSATTQGLLSPVLVYSGFGAFGAMVGYTLGSLFSGITAVSLLYLIIIRKLPTASLSKAKILQILKILLNYGIPLSVGTIIAGITPQILSFIMASFTDMAMIGNFRIATNFYVILSFFTYPVQTVLFPTFSKLDPSRDRQILKTIFASSIKYFSLFLVPATIALMVLSEPLVSTLYADKWPFAAFYLTLYVIGELLVLVGNLVYNRLLYATGKTRFLMKLSLLRLGLGIPLAFLMIPPLGILGLIVSSFVSGLPTVFIGLYWTWKKYETKADFQNSAKILFASLIAGAMTYLLLISLYTAAWIMLVAGAVIFLSSYIICIPIIGAVNQDDINNLRAMFSGLGPVSKLLQLPLIVIETVLKFKEKCQNSIKKNNFISAKPHN